MKNNTNDILGGIAIMVALFIASLFILMPWLTSLTQFIKLILAYFAIDYIWYLIRTLFDKKDDNTYTIRIKRIQQPSKRGKIK